MRKRDNFKLILLMVAIFVFSTIIAAQDGEPAEAQSREMQSEGEPQRRDVLRQLGLSRDQIQQIRRLNVETRPVMQSAQRRFRMAMRALDGAIYADQVNEADVQARLQEFHNAQAEVARVRFMKELAHRRILTADQLLRFRELRQKFERARQEGRRPG